MGNDMVVFFQGMVEAIVTFVSAPPITYLIGAIILVPIVKAVRAFVG